MLILSTDRSSPSPADSHSVRSGLCHVRRGGKVIGSAANVLNTRIINSRVAVGMRALCC